MIKKRRKAKKFLSLLLSVAMALTIFAGVGQVEVKADETNSGAEVTHTDHTGWIDLNSISSAEKYNGTPLGKNFEYQGRYYIEKEGNYYLSSDIVSDNSQGAILVGDGTNSCEVTICLHLHDKLGNRREKIGDMISQVFVFCAF
ncbi:MAG: hypothetical protein MSA09_07695 [Lachnospiraceae bacterium]|nr:hypothetical protein [Lachnospiraceae bacterium]